MVKESAPDEILLDDIMEEGMKNIGKGETAPVKEESTEEETPEQSPLNPQFGFKLEPVQARRNHCCSRERRRSSEEKTSYSRQTVTEYG